MNIGTYAIPLACAMVLASAASAQDIVPTGDETFAKWGDSAGWSIYIDEPRKSCLMQKFNGTDAIVQIGLSENKKLAYLGVFGKVEPAVRETHKNARTVIMIDDAQFEGKLRRFNKSDAEFHGAYVTTKDMDLAENVIASAQTAREAIVLSDSQLDFSVDLTGSAEALNAAKQCLAEQAG